MSEAGKTLGNATNVRSLADAVREMKNAAADRSDVVVDMREASRARLDLLVQELEPVFAEVPKDDPFFDLAISSGEQPRLWIDVVAHVTMGRDRRTYRFLRDTRLGRVVLAESTEIKPVADQVTRYIAERIVERQRAVEGEVEAVPRSAAVEAPVEDTAQSSLASLEEKKGRTGGAKAFWSGLFLVLLGGLVGAVGVVLAFLDRLPGLGAIFSGS
ncbi:hypothetical protein [Nitratireductor indicus]|uniref:hypothetical protein n=1 Tax=Nitratireductor indicus TaxID=721133 RepID=UPI002876B41C|nr:hypothetical protein [Nitratireductor indicus]MDS1135935.1 hypothetical protein [Nitratireductor indicus]